MSWRHYSYFIILIISWRWRRILWHMCCRLHLETFILKLDAPCVTQRVEYLLFLGRRPKWSQMSFSSDARLLLSTHLFSIFMDPKKAHARAEVVGVEQLRWCLCRSQCVSGTCFGTKLHPHFCLLRQPLITNTSTKSNFVAWVGTSTKADSKMTRK